MNILYTLLSYFMIPIAYLLGSIPTGIWYSKFVHQKDIRTMGSGNSGTTNVGRNFGLKAAVVVAIVDVLKGFLPVFITLHFFPSNHWLIMLVSLAAIIGHAYPYFADYKGGKIVATSIGVLLAINFSLAFIQVIMLFSLLYISSVMSFSALLSYGAVALYMIIAHPSLAFKMGMFIIYLFMLYRHRDNIQRLLKGNERQLKWGLHALNKNKD